MGLSAQGRTWAAATPHTLATEAAAVAFERGGNALDAALAAAATLAVCYPHHCGIGGDLFALVQQPSGQVVAVNASGRAPAAADPQAAAQAGPGGGSMPDYGPHTITVPGVVDGWSQLHHLGANLAWGDAFTGPVALALGGTRVSSSLARSLRRNAARVAADPGLAEVFLPGDPDAPPAEGSVFRQPALGATLRVIAAEGPTALYRGEVGARLVAGLQGRGVPIDEADLAGHTSELGSPLRGRFRDVDVLVHAPPSQGFTLLETLAAVERLELDPDPLGPDAGTLALTAWAASFDRDHHLADPDAMLIHPSTLLGDGHLAALCDAIRAGLDGDDGTAGVTPTHASGDTIGLVTADAEGRAVSLIQSLFSGFGSGILEPATGITLQNRGSGFTLDPDHPNVLAPGKRPAHTLTPVLVQRDGRFEAALGTMGGYAQPQIHAMLLARAFAGGLGAAAAVAAPRWLAGSIDGLGDTSSPSALVEGAVPEETRGSLRAAGFALDVLEADLDDSTGHAHMIRVTRDGSFDAGSDPRADGSTRAG